MTLKKILHMLEKIDNLQTKLRARSEGEIDNYTFVIGSTLSLWPRPDKFETQEICLQTITKLLTVADWRSNQDDIFDCVPQKFLTKGFFIKLLDADDRIMKWLPKTTELCSYAVGKSGRTLQFVPESMKTQELCNLAVTNCGYALKYVPEKYKTPELCLKAVKHYYSAFNYLPEELKTPEFCLEAGLRPGNVLEYLPDKYKTLKLCFEEVDLFCSSLEYVPDNFKTQHLCFMAVKNDGRSLEFVPEHLKTINLCIAAVKVNNSALGFMPPELVEQVLEAVREAPVQPVLAA